MALNGAQSPGQTGWTYYLPFSEKNVWNDARQMASTVFHVGKTVAQTAKPYFEMLSQARTETQMVDDSEAENETPPIEQIVQEKIFDPIKNSVKKEAAALVEEVTRFVKDLFGKTKQYATQEIVINTAKVCNYLLSHSNLENEKLKEEVLKYLEAAVKDFEKATKDFEEATEVFEKATEDFEAAKNNLEKKAIEKRERLDDVNILLKDIYDLLSSRHIVWNGIEFNQQPSANKELLIMRCKAENVDESNKSDIDGKNPLDPHILECSGYYQTLRSKFQLAPPSSPIYPSISETITTSAAEAPARSSSEEIENLAKETNKVVDRFCEMTVHYSTIYAMSKILSPGSVVDTNKINQILAKENPQAEYLQNAGGGSIRQFLYKCIYLLILKLISPIIRETIEGVTVRLRDFFSDNDSMLNFLTKETELFVKFFASIEAQRKEFLLSTHPHVEVTYEHQLKAFVSKILAETNSDKKFEKYIVSNYTPRPVIKVGQYRLPIISFLLEWIVYSVRKSLIHFFIRKTQLINTMISKGTGSIHYAQLGFRKMLETQFSEIAKTMERSQRDSVKPTSGQSTSSQNRQAVIIPPILRLKIKQLSERLLRFIEIQECNNSDSRLQNLDNHFFENFKVFLDAIRAVYHREPVLFRQQFENAITDLLENFLLSLFEDKERKIESHMRGIFETLEKTFSCERVDPQVYLGELESANDKLKLRSTEVTELALNAATDRHKKASTEKHRKNVEFVNQEASEIQELVNYLIDFEKALPNTLEKLKTDLTNPAIHEVKDEINTAVAKIEHFLNRASETLYSPTFKVDFYSDVRGDLCNGYAVIVKKLKDFALNKLGPALEEITDLEKEERTIINYAEASNKLKSIEVLTASSEVFLTSITKEEFAQKLESIKQLMPENQEMAALLDEMDLIRVHLELLNLEKENDEFKKELTPLRIINKKLQELSDKLTNQKEDIEGIKLIYEDLMEIPSLPKILKDLISMPKLDIHELYKKFYPRFSRGRSPVLEAFKTYTAPYRPKWDEYKTRRSELSKLRNPPVRVSVKNQQEIQMQETVFICSMTKKIQQGLAVIQEKRSETLEQHEKNLDGFKKYAKEFSKIGKRTQEVAKHFEVNGFWEPKLMEKKAAILGIIRADIVNSLNQLINACGNETYFELFCVSLLNSIADGDSR